jgi:hypothetical protein
MTLLVSKRLRSKAGLKTLTDDDMWDMIDQTTRRLNTMDEVRRRTRTYSEVTLTVSYPNGTKAPHMWNWQFLASKAFPDAEVELKCWQKPHPDWR